MAQNQLTRIYSEALRKAAGFSRIDPLRCPMCGWPIKIVPVDGVEPKDWVCVCKDISCALFDQPSTVLELLLFESVNYYLSVMDAQIERYRREIAASRALTDVVVRDAGTHAIDVLRKACATISESGVSAALEQALDEATQYAAGLAAEVAKINKAASMMHSAAQMYMDAVQRNAGADTVFIAQTHIHEAMLAYEEAKRGR